MYVYIFRMSFRGDYYNIKTIKLKIQQKLKAFSYGEGVTLRVTDEARLAGVTQSTMDEAHSQASRKTQWMRCGLQASRFA